MGNSILDDVFDSFVNGANYSKTASPKHDYLPKSPT